MGELDADFYADAEGNWPGFSGGFNFTKYIQVKVADVKPPLRDGDDTTIAFKLDSKNIEKFRQSVNTMKDNGNLARCMEMILNMAFYNKPIERH